MKRLHSKLTYSRGSNPTRSVLWSLAVLLSAALLLVGLTGSAVAGTTGNGTGGSGNKGSNTTGHKKCKPKPRNGGKAQANKNGKCKKRKPKPGKGTPPTTPVTPVAPVPPPVTPPPATPPAPPVTPPVTPPATTTLGIDPVSFDFGSVQHGGACAPDPDPDCPTHAFTVTNTGAAASGVPTASITELHNPLIGGSAAYTIVANTCTAALAPGASCSITVKFAPSSNAGDQMYSSRLDVTASPGSTVSSALSGEGV